MRFIEIVDLAYIVPDRLLWSTVVLLPKGDGRRTPRNRAAGAAVESNFHAYLQEAHEGN